MEKKWWRSKVLWVNLAIAMGTVAEANFGMLQAVLGPKVYLPCVSLVAGVNFFLRYWTTQGIEVKKP